MALQQINPLTYEHFIQILGESVVGLTLFLNNHDRGNWWNALQRYDFNQMNYIDGQNVRLQYHEEITQADNLEQKIEIANNILRWGQMNPLKRRNDE